MRKIYDSSGEYVGKASGPPPALCLQDPRGVAADRGRGAIRYQDHSVADALPRVSRSRVRKGEGFLKNDGNSLNSNYFFAPFGMPTQAD
ncbi:hypothetical protein CSUI_011025, partial [Cystoisospora suis]